MMQKALRNQGFFVIKGNGSGIPFGILRLGC